MFKIGTVVIGRKSADHYLFTRKGVKLQVINNEGNRFTGKVLETNTELSIFVGETYNDLTPEYFRRVNGHGK